MEKKYIVKLDDNKLAYTAIIIDGVPYIKPLQLLPYTEPDTSEAYQRGYDDAKHECQDCQKIMTDAEQERVDKAYQQGLEDARNRKATCEFCEYAGNDESNEPCVSCCCGYMNRFRPKKIKEEIQIGDEVKFYNGEKCVVTVVENGQVLGVMDRYGYSMEMDDGLRNSMNKTGRHFNELGKLLQKMNEDDG